MGDAVGYRVILLECMPAVVGDIVNAVINELSQVPGIATQIYASGRILQHVQDALLLEFEEICWPDYMRIGPMPLDGTTGLLAARPRWSACYHH